MNTLLRASVLFGVLMAIPGAGLASARSGDRTSKTAATDQASTAQIATHATKGVVKAIDATSLVITRSGGKRREMIFVLNPTTERDGNLAVGSTVEVRYRNEGRQLLATVVSVQERKQQEAANKTSSHR